MVGKKSLNDVLVDFSQAQGLKVRKNIYEFPLKGDNGAVELGLKTNYGLFKPSFLGMFDSMQDSIITVYEFSPMDLSLLQAYGNKLDPSYQELFKQQTTRFLVHQRTKEGDELHRPLMQAIQREYKNRFNDGVVQYRSSVISGGSAQSQPSLASQSPLGSLRYP